MAIPAPELNREYPELDDPRLFQDMVDLTVGQMRPIEGRLRRAQHAKTTGCVDAEFIVRDDIPDALKQGVFRQAKTFKAFVRFSNASAEFKKDGEGTARGMAIKLFDVAGARALPEDGDATQDFLLVNHPVFPFPDPKAYVEVMKLNAVPMVGRLLVFAKMALFAPKSLKIFKATTAHRIGNLLGTTYWSGSPYWLGSDDGARGHAVKYSAVPRQRFPEPARPEELPANYLTERLAEVLRDQEAIFDFKAQLQKDPVAMPVEDLTAEWDEALSPPVTMATLRIPPQQIQTLERHEETKCEPLSFYPWHALAAHRPMGGLNRLRKQVYLASFRKRSGAQA